MAVEHMRGIFLTPHFLVPPVHDEGSSACFSQAPQQLINVPEVEINDMLSWMSWMSIPSHRYIFANEYLSLLFNT